MKFKKLIAIILSLLLSVTMLSSCEEGIELGGERDYGVGMFFFPQDELKRKQAMKMFEIIVNKEGMEFLGWRNVPTEPTTLGQKAIDCMPCIISGIKACMMDSYIFIQKSRLLCK